MSTGDIKRTGGLFTDLSSVLNILGTKRDSSRVDTLTTTVISYLKAFYYHAHGENFVYPQDGTFFKTITTDATAYTHGAKLEVIPADAIDRPFDLHWIEVEDVSAVGDYEVKLWIGGTDAETEIGAYRFGRSTVHSRDSSKAILVAPIPAGTRVCVSLACSDAGAKTCKVALEGHKYDT